jgi:uncharacterized protein (DUF4415 family)
MANRKNKEQFVKYVGKLPNGEHVVEHADGRLEKRKSRTDWAALDAMTEEELEASIASDPDWADMDDIDWSDAVLVAPPQKTPISIRVDDDVLDFFKKEGAGYQRRINAVLRSYVEQKKAPPKRKKRA